MQLNRFYISDAAEFMASMPENYVDLTVTSPPYDNLRIYKGYSFDYKSILSGLYRVTKSGGVVVWVVGDATIKGSETLTSFKQAIYAKEVGFNIHDTMIYQKAGGMPSKTRYQQQFEYMFIFSKGNPKTTNLIKDKKNNRGGLFTFGAISFRNKDGSVTKRKKIKINEFGLRENIWRYVNGYGWGQKDDLAYKHPATFPEQLAQDHIISWSNKGDIIFDPMCGSGTTCKNAYLSNRYFIGVDCSPEYINDICIPRLSKYMTF